MGISVQARLLNVALRLAGVKRFARAPEAEFERKLREGNRKRGYFMPTDARAHYEDCVVEGRYHCLRIQKEKKPSERAVLYFFGGGMLMDADKGDVDTARRLMKATGCDVWLLFYPLCLDHDIEENIKVAFECYRRMVKVYGAGNVSTCGCSSGGMLAMAVGLYNNALSAADRLPMPRHVVPISPGEVPLDPQERARMEALNPKDLMVDIAFMTRVEKFMRKGRDDIPHWMIHPSEGDFTGFPTVHFFYSEDECLYGALPNFAAALEKRGVPYEVYSRPGMIHCFPVIEFLPEGREAFDRVAEILRG